MLALRSTVANRTVTREAGYEITACAVISAGARVAFVPIKLQIKVKMYE
jgi:hypothetical protein